MRNDDGIRPMAIVDRGSARRFSMNGARMREPQRN